jgi:hypothetical protein
MIIVAALRYSPLAEGSLGLLHVCPYSAVRLIRLA